MNGGPRCAPGVVVIGGGHAGVQTAETIRKADPDVDITVLSDEVPAPYQRPPLSKSLWSTAVETLPLRNRDFFADRRIDLRQGDPVTAIERDHKRVTLRSGGVLAYRDLVIATGSRPRRLALPGADLDGVFYLRDLADATRLHRALRGVRHLAVLGGGFIGLEVAASSAAVGLQVTVLEAAPRMLARSVSAQTSGRLYDWHVAQGVRLRAGVRAVGLVGDRDRVTGVVTADGATVACDAVLIGAGSQPNTEVALAAGLADENGVLVDRYLRTGDPAIWSVGDCASFPAADGARRRLESVQNAVDQGRRVSANIVATAQGRDLTAFRAVAWFWSQQASLKLQIAGVADTTACEVYERRYDEKKFSHLLVHEGRLMAVESVNAAADHLAARKLLEVGATIDPVRAQDVGVPLRTLIPEAGELSPRAAEPASA
ncbi:NAD(P)/FAD-dependent oxidoreductase [Streptomyces sp. NPDC091217]|uniref:NAD(P)/FAD-dependent oxidoreductase n=1 Tax=Streptomyces sp. NPDC091217 TaxID=3365975 RepID=UPI00382F3E05